MPVANDEHNLQILQTIAAGERVTQRSLASETGVALGLMNLLIRRLVAKGYVRVAGMGRRHIRYLLTAAGREALGQATRASLENTVRLYTETREHIRAGLSSVSDRCEVDASGQKRIVFYGAGDVAEIAYVSLQGTDLTLVGVVDDHRTGQFFGMPIRSSDELSADKLGDVPYAYVIGMSLRHTDSIRARLDARRVAASKVFCL